MDVRSLPRYQDQYYSRLYSRMYDLLCEFVDTVDNVWAAEQEVKMDHHELGFIK